MNVRNEKHYAVKVHNKRDDRWAFIAKKSEKGIGGKVWLVDDANYDVGDMIEIFNKNEIDVAVAIYKQKLEDEVGKGIVELFPVEVQIKIFTLKK